jgi:nitroimidazol reductase NimA-like FMN-containing flavoprotein (pyridoxamine 5'-phosphate oxidase superfamily)
MKQQYHPVRDNDVCEAMIRGTFQGVLAMSDDGEPYAIPVNHAYEDGRFTFHLATSGRKLDIIERNPNVTYVITRFYGDRRDLDKSLRCHGPWESVIAYGKARVVSEHDELIRTFRSFMAYFGEPDYQHGENLLANTRVIVIDVERMTARREYDEFRTDYWYWER